MPTTTETIPEWKYKEIADIEAILEGASSVGVVNIAGIPSRQMQVMRRDIHDIATLRVSRNTLMRRALEGVDDGLETLVEYVDGPVGLIVTEANPFTLYQRLEASKTPAPIGAGEIAPNDIVIEAGDTGMDPGPFVGDLQNVGVPARIDEGSIKVLETTTVCEAGDEVSIDLAGVLNELDLEPKEVGLDLRAVYADGVLFEASELVLDTDEYRSQFAAGAATARTLAVEVAYPASGAVEILLTRADARATQLAVAAGFIEPDTADAVLAAARADVLALARAIDDPDAIPSDLREAADAEPAPTVDEHPADADEPAEEAADDEVEDDEEDEADASGLGDLFG